MLYLNKQNFYYGAILSALIGKKYKTVLIDGDSDDKRIYQFSSDTDSDFISFLVAISVNNSLNLGETSIFSFCFNSFSFQSKPLTKSFNQISHNLSGPADAHLFQFHSSGALSPLGF